MLTARNGILIGIGVFICIALMVSIDLYQRQNVECEVRSSVNRDYYYLKDKIGYAAKHGEILDAKLRFKRPETVPTTIMASDPKENFSVFVDDFKKRIGDGERFVERNNDSWSAKIRRFSIEDYDIEQRGFLLRTWVGSISFREDTYIWYGLKSAEEAKDMALLQGTALKTLESGDTWMVNYEERYLLRYRLENDRWLIPGPQLGVFMEPLFLGTIAPPYDKPRIWF